ncbi:hypothetical protein A6456_29940 [Paraburkholderia tropica]|nr:hypothetical protein A6456_29940 [Paraburkholderia tropica]
MQDVASHGKPLRASRFGLPDVVARYRFLHHVAACRDRRCACLAHRPARARFAAIPGKRFLREIPDPYA